MTFEAGKRYRLCNGMTTGPLRLCPNTVFRWASEVDGLISTITWTEDGSYSTVNFAPHYNLVPGAIEDEKPEAVSIANQPDVFFRTLEGHQKQIDAARQTIASQAVVIAGMASKIEADGREIADQEERVDNIEKHCEAMQSKIEEMQSSIDATINGVSKLYEERADRTKPTIKGGWVNVYAGDLGFASLSDWTYETKREADFKANPDRLACIQIPDITEGEGL